MRVGAAFLRAFGDLADPALRGAAWRALATAAAAFVGLAIVVQLLLARLDMGDGWLSAVAGWAVGVLGGLATVVVIWVLFPAVATFFVGLQLERVAAALERRHYPHRASGRDPSLASGLAAGLRFAVVAVALNLAALVVYAALALTGVLAPLAPVVFYTVNGYLLGREYYETVALRHLDPRRAREWRQRHRGSVFAAGVGVTMLFTVPLVNLAAPLVGLAAMVHLFHGRRRRAA